MLAVSHAGEEQREKGGEGDKHKGNEGIFDDNTRGQTIPSIKEEGCRRENGHGEDESGYVERNGM